MKILTNNKYNSEMTHSYTEGWLDGHKSINQRIAKEILSVACQIRRMDTWDKELQSKLVGKLLEQYKILAGGKND